MDVCQESSLKNVTLKAFKSYIDEILAFEGKQTPSNSFKPDDYPLKEVIDSMWKLLVNASKGAAYMVDGDFKNKQIFGGLAISPSEASSCINDFIRTGRFIAGACAAIKEAQKKFPGQKLTVVDPSCGPFGLLSIAAMTQFSADEVEFYLIDVFKNSLRCVKEILKTLGLESYCRKIINNDAAKVRLGKKVHVVLAEAINRGLRDETQIPITLNWAPQLEAGGIFVPESIDVKACMALEDGEMVLGPVTKVTKDISLATLGASRIESERGIETHHRFRLPPIEGKGHVYLSTAVHIFGPYKLHPNESSITAHLPIGRIRWNPDTPKTFVLHTTFGGNDDSVNKGYVE